MKSKLTAILLTILLASACAAPAFARDTMPPSSYPLYSGIDVSAWQDTIDWARAASSGVEIVYIRATEGDRYVDPKLAENAAGARGAGLKIGYYHFLTAETPDDARNQAAFFVSTLQHGGYIADCRPVMDFGTGGSLSVQEFNAVAAAFLETLEQLTNVTPMIYSDAYGARTRYDAAMARYPLWVADYGVTEPEANGKWPSYAGFQYSDRGKIEGISTNVDLDLFTKEVFSGEVPVPTPTPLPTVTPTPVPTPTPIPTPTPVPTPSPSPTPRPTVAAVVQYYQAQPGDTVLSIASRYAITPAQLLSQNALIPKAGLPSGQILRILTEETPKIGAYASLYLPANSTTFAFTAMHFFITEDALLKINQQPSGTAVAAGQAIKIPPLTGRASILSAPDQLLENAYVVQNGDTVSSVSAAFSLSESELRAYNGLQSSAPIYPGQILHLIPFGVPSDAARFYGAYVVQRGDSLSKIARMFDTTISALYDANDLRSERLLVIGQVLIIP